MDYIIFTWGDKTNLATKRPLLCITQTRASDFWAPLKPQASEALVFILFKVNATCLTVGKLSLFCFLGRISHLLSFTALKKIAFKIELVKSNGSLLNNLYNACLLSQFISIHSFTYLFRAPWEFMQFKENTGSLLLQMMVTHNCESIYYVHACNLNTYVTACL